MSHENEDRNKIMVLTRFSDPVKYSYSIIGEMFNPPITKQTVHNICVRDWQKYLTKAQLKKRPNPNPSGVINKNIYKNTKKVQKSP